MQYPCSSSEQILVHGERGRSHSAGAFASGIRCHYEAGTGMFKPQAGAASASAKRLGQALGHHTLTALASEG
jgi:hypothetical protein